MYTRAITRKPGTNLAQGLTASTLGLPSYELSVKQHEAYVETLKLLGLTVIELDVSEMQKMDGGLTCLSIRF